MKKTIGMMMLLVGVAEIALAGAGAAPPSTPEIDASAGVSALALLAGAFFILKGRRNQ